MKPDRQADTFILRVRREQGQASGERWQVEHVQTGMVVYVHSLDEVMPIIRTILARRPGTQWHRP